MDADRRIETAKRRSSFASDSRVATKRDDGMLADNGECDFVPVDAPSRWDIKSEAVAVALSVRTKQLVESLLAKAARPGIGAMNAVKKGIAVVDEDGRLRCPPGTPNAMEFTDNLGTNCGIPGARVAQASIGTVAGVVGSEKLPRIGAAEVAKNRPADIARRSMRATLAEGAKRFLTRTSKKGDQSSAWAEAFRSLSEPGMGFSFDLSLGESAKEGYAIARPGRGIAVRADSLFDENGDPLDEGATSIARMIAANADGFTTPAEIEVDGKKIKAERVVLGGWHSDKAHNAEGELVDIAGNVVTDGDKAARLEDAREAGIEVYGFAYFDVSDVFPESIGDGVAYEIGRDRNQQSIANLRLVDGGNYDGVTIDDINNGLTAGFIDTGGTGGDLLPSEEFDSTVQSAVRSFAKDGPLEQALKSIGGSTMDVENFTPKQVRQMLGYMKKAPGFEWIDPEDESHLAAVVSQLSDNLMFLMDGTTEGQRKTWSRWYDIANEFSKRTAKATGVSERTMAAVIASLSPQKDWDQNTAMAEHLARLLSDKDMKLSEEVSERAVQYAVDQWRIRNLNGENSYAERVASIEAKISEAKDDPSAVAALRAELESLDERVKADPEPSLLDFVGKSVASMSDGNAVAAIRAHSELEGGRYLGMPDSPSKTNKGNNSLSRLRPYETKFGDGGPGDHTLVPKEGTVMATSFPTYMTAVRLFRSDGDPATVDRLLRGSKVRSFFNNILMPNDTEQRDVTIDTHAVAAELLVPVSAQHVITELAFSHVEGLGTARAYPLMRAAMIATAIRWEEKTGEKYLPRQIQSITWEKMRASIPASLKKYAVDRMAQVQTLGSGPKAKKSLSGDNRLAASAALIEAATVDLKQAAKASGRKLTREQLVLEVAQDLGLPKSVVAVPRAKQGDSGS